MKRFFKIFGICFLSGLLLIASGYFYLDSKISPAEIKTESVPYTFSDPENSGIVLNINNTAVFLYLDFGDESLKVIFPTSDTDGNFIYGYTVDYRVSADLSLITEIVDSAGGIELSLEDETLRYTGVQVADVLSRTAENDGLKRDVARAIMVSVSENGIDNDIFKIITEQTETDLTIPDCYYWGKYLKKLCKNGVIIN